MHKNEEKKSDVRQTLTFEEKKTPSPVLREFVHAVPWRREDDGGTSTSKGIAILFDLQGRRARGGAST